MSGRRNPPAKWVLPLVVDPPTRTCYTIPVPDDPQHRAAFRGALLNLASATKWQYDPAHTAKEAAAVWREIYDLVVECENSTTTPESWDEDLTSLCEALRYQNGKLQALCCGTWTDISGQPAQGWLPGATGSGVTPPSSGACKTYNAQLSGNGYWYSPFVVSSGDTIAVSNAKGATYNPAAVIWQCPDGSLFFAGACISSTVTAAGNPLPAVLSGKLIAKIGSTFYDVSNGGTFTVPGGISSQPVQFQINYASLTGSSGDITFDVVYCNNAATSYTHTFDFTITNGGFAPLSGLALNGSWTPGTGWVAGTGVSGGVNVRLVNLRLFFAARTIDSAYVTFDYTKGTIASPSGHVWQVSQQTSYWLDVLASATVNGTNLLRGSAASYAGSTELDILIQCHSDASAAAGLVTVKKLVVTGPGADPF